MTNDYIITLKIPSLLTRTTRIIKDDITPKLNIIRNKY